MKVIVSEDKNIQTIISEIKGDARKSVMNDASRFAKSIAPYDSKSSGKHLRDSLLLKHKKNSSSLTLLQPTGKRNRPYHMIHHRSKDSKVLNADYHGKDRVFMDTTFIKIKSMVARKIERLNKA